MVAAAKFYPLILACTDSRACQRKSLGFAFTTIKYIQGSCNGPCLVAFVEPRPTRLPTSKAQEQPKISQNSFPNFPAWTRDDQAPSDASSPRCSGFLMVPSGWNLHTCLMATNALRIQTGFAANTDFSCSPHRHMCGSLLIALGAFCCSTPLPRPATNSVTA